MTFNQSNTLAHSCPPAQGHLGIKADAKQPPDFAAIDLEKDLVGVDPFSGKLVGRHSPYFGDMGPVLRVIDVAPAVKLIAPLTVLAPALAVGLPGSRAVDAALAPDPPGGRTMFITLKTF